MTKTATDNPMRFLLVSECTVENGGEAWGKQLL